MFGARCRSIDAYRFGFNGHEKDNEVAGIGNHLSFGDYGYSSRLDRRWNIDPMTEKYPGESSYMVFGDNPIWYRDPDGKEKIIALDNKKEGDRNIIAGASKFEDDGAIHIFAHGGPKGMTLVVGGKEYKIDGAKKDGAINFSSFLSKHSTVWQNKTERDKPVIVLHSCRTGQEAKDGSASLAEKISESKLFEDVTIIAPDQRDYIGKNGEIGPYKAKYADEHGDYKRGGRR